MKPIRLFEPRYRVDECLAQIRECLESGWTGIGGKATEFEAAWCAQMGFPHAHFVNSATSGLHLAVNVLKEAKGWPDGSEVITTPITFVSTNHVLLYEKLRPVFADVDESGCLDADSVREQITKETRAVMFVGLGGNSAQLPEIMQLCRDRGLCLIVDAAHMAGTLIIDKHAGCGADATVFSFHAVKNLPIADAGMVCFNLSHHDRIARKLSWLGIDKTTAERSAAGGGYDWHYDVPLIGFKYHGNALAAGIGLAQLGHLLGDNKQRRMVANWYDDYLPRTVQRVEPAGNCVSARHLYQVLVPERDDVILRLREQGIQTGVHYRDNTDYPMYRDSWGPPRARDFSARVLSLPMHLKLTEGDVSRVASELKAAVAGG
jgi:dTDP-4-amino-4,6-dideoxygalactose transaminase